VLLNLPDRLSHNSILKGHLPCLKIIIIVIKFLYNRVMKNVYFLMNLYRIILMRGRVLIRVSDPH
jgi:hypothetical protein